MKTLLTLALLALAGCTPAQVDWVNDNWPDYYSIPNIDICELCLRQEYGTYHTYRR